MERFIGKVAVVTGSSSGIGEGISKALVKRGLIVVGLARRIEKLQDISNEIKNNSDFKLGKFHAMQCDIFKENEIKNTFSLIKSNIGPISVLVNNAGTLAFPDIKNVEGKDVDNIFDVHVKGLLLCSKEAILSMTENSTEGHIININSIAGHYPPKRTNHFLYPAAKHAARILSEGLRMNIIEKKLNIKISNISPGLVKTPLIQPTHFFAHYMESEKEILQVQDVVNACIAVLDTPPRVLIADLIVVPIHNF